MNLVTPDSGLLFWMVIIFGLLFFILAKFGFPIITSMVDKRDAAIQKSLTDAKEIEKRMTEMVKEHSEMIETARKEQAAIMKEASAARDNLIEKAKEQAREEADKIISDARVQIAAEKESAMRDIRKEVALLSVSVAEKILRKDLEGDPAQNEYLDRLVDEAERKGLES